MISTETKQGLSEEFATCVQQEKIPPLDTYLSDYVQSGCAVESSDYRLVPITTTARRFYNASSDCVTDCMLELQCKYQQLIPDSWGGRMERGWRDIGVIGFNILDGGGLEILEINETNCHVEWAAPVRKPLYWERLLIRAVVDFGRTCGLEQIRLQPAHRCFPAGAFAAGSVESSAAFQEAAKQRYDGSAEALGFKYDQATDSFVFELD
jgi:hypothetical protein